MLDRIAQHKEEADAIQHFWQDMLPEVDIPGGGQWRVWLKQYGFDTVVAGIEAMLVKFNLQVQQLAADQLTQAPRQQRRVPSGAASICGKGMLIEEYRIVAVAVVGAFVIKLVARTSM